MRENLFKFFLMIAGGIAIAAAFIFATTGTEKNHASETKLLSEKKAREARQAERINIQDVLGEQTLVEWLTAHGPDPDLWHQIARDTDPDGRIELYAWIVEQPACDQGTAGIIFQWINAYDILVYEPRHPSDHLKLKTARTIIDRWNANDFKTYEFANYDMQVNDNYENYKGHMKASADKFGEPLFIVPESIFEYTTGRREPDPDYFFSDFY